jgi:hypothetical protein
MTPCVVRIRRSVAGITRAIDPDHHEIAGRHDRTRFRSLREIDRIDLASSPAGPPIGRRIHVLLDKDSRRLPD